jgi:hydrogenase expression/formation protein HypE
MTQVKIKKPHTSLDLENGLVEMAHGSGGKASSRLIEELFLQQFDNDLLNQQSDQATFPVEAGRMVMATDSHVITPLFFPGGNIGSLAVHGTVNDVCVSGAVPQYLSVGFILEEGFPLQQLVAIVASMAEAAKAANVNIVTGDTKVVERGKADGVFINTTGVGFVPNHLDLQPNNIQVGDKIIINGSLGDHGIAILSKRENLTFETELASDSASLNSLTELMTKTVPNLHYMRDPTRGGVGAVLNELCKQQTVGALLFEKNLPVKPAVKSACELLGIDPIHVANEGKLLAFCPSDKAETLVNAMQQHPLGQQAQIIGEVIEDPNSFVQLETTFGGRRIIDWINGEQLPRIC